MITVGTLSSFKSHRERERENESPICSLIPHNAYTNQEWSGLLLGARNPVQVSCWDGRDQHLGHPWVPLRLCVRRKLASGAEWAPEPRHSKLMFTMPMPTQMGQFIPGFLCVWQYSRCLCELSLFILSQPHEMDLVLLWWMVGAGVPEHPSLARI